MQSLITGKAYVLGDNIDTDQMIPAKYLSFNPSIPEERKFFGMYAMSSVPEAGAGLPGGHIRFVRDNEFKSDYQIIIGGKNFGSGSSREHAPLALAEAGVKCVIAEFYARIFYRNSINGGYLIPFESEQRLVEKIHTGDELEVHLDDGYVINKSRNGARHNLRPLGDVLPIIEAGGIFPYAKKTGMLKYMPQTNVNIIDHPVIQTKLTELRDYTTDHRKFRALLNEIASLMVYEVTRDWPTMSRPVQTPLERTTGRVLARRVTLVPILRAGLGMADGVLRLLPEARMGHIGVYRDEKTLEPVSYYQKLPPDIAATEVLLIDPMLATGGSGVAAVTHLKAAGVTGMKFVCLVAAPEGIQTLHRQHPDVPIYCAAIDRQLNDKGYILPGLGDAGDRIFGT